MKPTHHVSDQGADGRQKPARHVLSPDMSPSLLGSDIAAKIGIMSSASEIPIDRLTVSEKLMLMDRLWADLSRCPADVPSPDWHGDVLAERLAAVGEGKVTWIDWDDAKKRLRDRLL